MSKTILVTGGAGYIGSHVVNLLGKEGYDIVIVDDLSTGNKESVLYGELIVHDIGDRVFLEQLFKKYQFSACLHFAGSISVPESVENPIKYYRNNVVNSLILIEACLKHQVNRFIFSSTAAIYGNSKNGIASENDPVHPISPYGRTKLMTEWILEDASRIHQLKYVALRYFNVAGNNVEGLLGQRTPQAAHLIKVACETALGKRKEMSIFGDDYQTSDGSGIRDYIHVDDLAQAHVDALRYLEKGGTSQALNCGYGKGASVKEIIEIVKKVSGVDFKVEIGPRREGDIPALIAEAKKIGKVLGWKPKYQDLELIIKTTLDWEKKLL